MLSRTPDEGNRTQLLRYSGLRIGDAAALPKDRIQARRLLLYTQETDTPVSLLLPQALVDALGQLETKWQRYWFWTGEGKPATLAGNMRRSFWRMQSSPRWRMHIRIGCATPRN